MAKKRRTSRKPGRKEALAVIILAMFVGLARQMLAPSYDLSNILDYDGTSAYAVIDRNQPSFTEEEYTTDSYEYYSELDLYNRCHLIGFQLTGENANEKNLVTGTRYMNVEGMLPFENQVADYVASTGNHVLYRVTPAFVDTELVARGVEMEAYSVEDQGRGVCFHVYCYNVQPGVEIDYATGENWEA